MSQIHVKENSKRIWILYTSRCTRFLEVKPMYIRAKGIKSHVWKFLHVFRDDLGKIKGTKMVHGVCYHLSCT